MREASLDKPEVHHNSSGVVHVKPADILASKQGRAEIQKAAHVAIARNIRSSDPSKSGVLPKSR